MVEDKHLDVLFTDSGQIDQKALSEALQPYILINREEGTVIFHRGASGLKANQKVMLVLLGRKAWALGSGADSARDVASRDDIVAMTGLKKGTVDPTLKDLRDAGLVVSPERGTYAATDALWEQAIALFQDGKDGQ